MLKITIELLPSDGSEARILDSIIIANTGSGDKIKGNYMVLNNKFLVGCVKGFDRTRSPWDLLYLALENMLVKRKKEERE